MAEPHSPSSSVVPDGDELEQLLLDTRERLRPIVRLRMDLRLRRRMDVSDVLQDALAEIAARLDEYRNEYHEMPFFAWARLLTGWKLAELHRRHLGARGRDLGREVSWEGRTGPGISSQQLVEIVSAAGPTPSEVAFAREDLERLADALEEIDTVEREVLTLRHFEQLSNQEVSHLLGLSRSAASRAYGRALQSLNRRLAKGDG